MRLQKVLDDLAKLWFALDHFHVNFMPTLVHVGLLVSMFPKLSQMLTVWTEHVVFSKNMQGWNIDEVLAVLAVRQRQCHGMN